MKRKLACAAEWIGINLVLPLIPIIVRILVRFFSSDRIALWEPNDLLYYSFFICLLMLSGLRKRNGLVAACARYLLFFVCLVDNLLIVLVLQESANEYVLPFSLMAAAICAGFGVIFAVADAFSGNGGDDRA